MSEQQLNQQVESILASMTIEDKVGQLFQDMAFLGDPTKPNPFSGAESVESMIRNRRISHFNALGPSTSAEEFASWQNQIQEIAKDAGFKVPVTISTDPRHAFTDNMGTAFKAGAFSEWPESLGLAAVGDPELVREFADTARREYLAVGLRAALHPQIDLATEPRWSRASGTFGESMELTCKLAPAYIQGFQNGSELGPESVSTMTKHFPGGGPQKDGEDPHFEWGKEQVYPGGMWDLHLEPFKAAIAAGTAQMMPYYGQPIGTEYEEVAFGFNRGVVTNLLRDELGFEGVVCTDWGLITEHMIMGQMWTARAWGVEHLTPKERLVKALNAGVDQFGGENCTELMLELVAEGLVTEERIDSSVRRLILQKLQLGLFENAIVDVAKAKEIVGSPENRAAGLTAQKRAVTVLTNQVVDGSPALPLTTGIKVYAEGLDPEVLAKYATIVDSPDSADVAIVRTRAPFEQRGKGFEMLFPSGSLDFSAAEIERIIGIAAKVPTILDVYLDRPAILTPFVDSVAAIIGNFGISSTALLEVLFGKFKPEGKLPFEIPRSMAAVEASREDVPFDTENPVFRFGHGLSI